MTIFTMPPCGNLGGRRVGKDYMQEVEARAKRLKGAKRPVKVKAPDNQLDLPMTALESIPEK